MAPVLFLFLMTAFAETLEDEWNRNNLKKISFSHATLNNLSSGQLIGHPTRKSYKGDNSEILQILYMDDGSFLFNSREDLEIGLEMIYTHFSRFGLEMHIGRNNQTSKTECIFFPPPGYFNYLHKIKTLPSSALPSPQKQFSLCNTPSNKTYITILSNRQRR